MRFTSEVVFKWPQEVILIIRWVVTQILGSCDIEKNRYIDIERKKSIISTISNYTNEKT